MELKYRGELKMLQNSIDLMYDTLKGQKLENATHEAYDAGVLIKYNFIVEVLNANFKKWDIVENSQSSYITVWGIKNGDRSNKYYFIKKEGIKEHKKGFIFNFLYDDYGVYLLAGNEHPKTFLDLYLNDDKV